MSAALSIHIDAPVKKVFDFYKDPRNQWATGSDQMIKYGKLTDATMTKEGVGTFDSWTFGFGVLRMEGFDVITEFVPNERMTFRSSSHMVGTLTCTFEPEGSGTRFTLHRHPGSFWALRPVNLLVERLFASTWQQSLEKLKAELEKPVAPTRATTAAGHSAP